MIQETVSDVGSKLVKGAKDLGSNITEGANGLAKLLTKEYNIYQSNIFYYL
jgi:hypothetical protein